MGDMKTLMKIGKINQVDFLFLSEVPEREERSLILLTEELKRRGYTAEYLLFGEWGNHRYKKKIGVLVVNSCFDRHALEHTVYTIAGKMDKVVALRWEQIPSNHDEESEISYEAKRVSKTAKTFNTFAWGDDYCNRMAECGIEKKYIHKTGPIFMDFLRPDFREIYKSREDIIKKYGIPSDKKILLFISDFFILDLTKEEYDYYIKEYGTKDMAALVDFEKKTQKTILDWFERLLSDKTCEWVIVYRKHPGIKEGTKAIELSKRKDGFYYISDLPAQQWIVIADKVATVQSTMISETFFSGKDILIIRPFEVPKHFDSPLYNNIEYISKYEEFRKAVYDNYYISTAAELKKYYDVKEKPSYLRCADALELVYKSKKYNSIWDEDDLHFVKKYSILRRLRIINHIVGTDIKKSLKTMLRKLHKVYNPKSKLLKKYIKKSENIVKHDEKFRKQMVYILNKINR